MADTLHGAGVLEARGLQRPGLGPVDLRVAAGRCLLVRGPSGAGKSLLLRALADLDPAQGEVRLAGTERSAMTGPAWRKAVTYVAAEPGWWAETVAEHFTDATHARRSMADLGLPAELLEAPVARLSTGERQRMALLRALEHHPRVLLLDEPTAALDGASAKRVETLLRRVMAAGAALVIVTHDDQLAARLGGEVLRLERGVPVS